MKNILKKENETQWHAKKTRVRTIKKRLLRIAAFLFAAWLPLLAFGAEKLPSPCIISPTGASTVLQVVGEVQEGALVSLNRLSDDARQKWVIEPRGDAVLIRSAANPVFVLAVPENGVKDCTRIALSKESDQPWQLWKVVKRDDGNYVILSKGYPTFGFDDFRGDFNTGAQIDVFTYIGRENDTHLHWQIESCDEKKRYEPASVGLGKILPGVVKLFTFQQSRIFPGTFHRGAVFIPAQCTGDKPAPVVVVCDGLHGWMQTQFETLIAAGEMPPAVVIGVQAGELPPPATNTAIRSNRDFEYDSVSDRNVQFLTQELLPFVTREFGLNLSTNGNDRCIAGCSSGGMAAFTAAWNRPGVIQPCLCRQRKFRGISRRT